MSETHESQEDLLNDHKLQIDYKNKLAALSNNELFELQQKYSNDKEVDRQVELIYINGELRNRLKAKERAAVRDERKLQKDMLKITRRSNLVSFGSLIIAGSALLVSYNSTNSSARWESNQLLLLEQIKKEAKNITDKSQQALEVNIDRNIQESRRSTTQLISTIESLNLDFKNKLINKEKKKQTHNKAVKRDK